jgi:hypothetical protein
MIILIIFFCLGFSKDYTYYCQISDKILRVRGLEIVNCVSKHNCATSGKFLGGSTEIFRYLSAL